MNDRITIADKELIFAFDVAAWIDLEKAFGSIDRMYKRFEEDVLPFTTGVQLAAICATSGTCDRKKKEQITLEWLVENATPRQAQEMAGMARMAILRGMETTESIFEEEGAVDVGLEEDAEKKTRADA